MFELLWKIPLWRSWLVALLARGWCPGWLVYHSGLMLALRDLAIRGGDLEQAVRCSGWLRDYERSHMMGA